MPGNPRRLVRYDGEGWVVVSPGAERASYRSPDRGEAIARARRIVRNIGGGEIEVHDRGDRVERVVEVRRSRATRPDLRPH